MTFLDVYYISYFGFLLQLGQVRGGSCVFCVPSAAARPDYWWFGLVLLSRGVAVSVPSVFFAGNPSLVKLLMSFVLLLGPDVGPTSQPIKQPKSCESASAVNL